MTSLNAVELFGCPQSRVLVPICISASRSVYEPLRMEPVYMVLGQAVATEALLSIDGDQSVQEVPYEKLNKQLVMDGQILKASKKKPQP